MFVTGSSGSGAAGRIALHIKSENTFQGSFMAYSEKADVAANTGAAGTVYIKDVVKKFERQRLLVNNQGGPVNRFAVVEEGSNVTAFQFDQMEILRQASLHFISSSSVSIDVRVLSGDRTGLIHIHDKQKLISEYEESRLKAFTTGMNFIVDEGGEIIFPAFMYVYGDHDHAVQWFGQLTGISLLVIGQDKSVLLGAKAHTAYIQNGTYLYINSNGNLTFGTLDLRGNSTMKWEKDLPMVAEIGFVEVRYKAAILAESVQLRVSRINVEAGATITTAAFNRSSDTLESSEG